MHADDAVDGCVRRAASGVPVRRLSIGFVALVGCSPCRPAKSPPPIVAVEVPVAQGALRLATSSQGRFLLVERPTTGAWARDLAVIERATAVQIARVRGTAVAGPSPDGELLYVDDEDPPHLRSTLRSSLARELPSGVWTGHELGTDAVVLLRHSDDVEGHVVRRSDGTTTARRGLSRVLSATTHPGAPRLYVSVRSVGGGGTFVALDETLTERWRRPWPSGRELAPILAVTGDGARLVTATPGALVSLDAHHGTDEQVLPVPGPPIVDLATMSKRSLVAVLQLYARAPETPRYCLGLFDTRDGTWTTLRAGEGRYPRAIAFAGGELLVAP